MGSKRNIVLALGAHPDDMEFFAGGTLALLAQKGYEVVIVSMTSGECGSRNVGPDEIASIRQLEAEKGASKLGARYKTLEIQDGCISGDLDTVIRVVGLIQEIRPKIIITHPPVDYMADHIHTSQLVHWAVSEATHTNFPVKTDAPVLRRKPYVYHTDPEGLTNSNGQIPRVNTIVDISSVFDLKLLAIAAHESQNGPEGILVKLAQTDAMVRGRQARIDFGEGFTQQLFDGYPQSNILKAVLGRKVLTL